MSEEPLAYKNRPPDAEYDSIYATMAETAQGRRFLEEHARRSAPRAELAVIERMQVATGHTGDGRLDLFLLEVAEMAEAIARTRAEVASIRPPEHKAQIEAAEQLDAIVQTTEIATSRILSAAEQMHEIAWLLREQGASPDICDQLEAQATEIYTACGFQDITGQRIRAVIEVLRYLEIRINAMVDIWGNAAEKTAQPAGSASHTPALEQAQVDAVMQPAAATEDDDRQDATLEDIHRFMRALQPLMDLHQEAAAETSPSRDETRPELSVAETVRQEAETAQALAEWIAEPGLRMEELPRPESLVARPQIASGAESKAPIAASEASREIGEWKVEPPVISAATPEIDERPAPEPPWAVLQRLQTTPDFPLPEVEIDSADSDAAAAAMPAVEPPPAIAKQPEPVKPPQNDLMARMTAMMPSIELDLPAKRAKAPEPGDGMPLPLPGAKTEILAVKSEEPSVETAPAPELGAEKPSAPELPPAAPARVEAPLPASDLDADDFLFESEAGKPAETSAPDSRNDHAPPPESAAPLPAMEWKDGSVPNPVPVTPPAVAASAVAQQKPKASGRAAYDPLAPLRALSDEEKIALFS